MFFLTGQVIWGRYGLEKVVIKLDETSINAGNAVGCFGFFVTADDCFIAVAIGIKDVTDDTVFSSFY